MTTASVSVQAVNTEKVLSSSNYIEQSNSKGQTNNYLEEQFINALDKVIIKDDQNGKLASVGDARSDNGFQDGALGASAKAEPTIVQGGRESNNDQNDFSKTVHDSINSVMFEIEKSTMTHLVFGVTTRFGSSVNQLMRGQ